MFKVVSPEPLPQSYSVRVAWYGPECDACVDTSAWPEGLGPLVLFGSPHIHRCAWCDHLFFARGSAHRFCSSRHRVTFHNKNRG